MSKQVTAWIRRVATLNDADMEEEFKWINKNPVNAFAKASVITQRIASKLVFFGSLWR